MSVVVPMKQDDLLPVLTMTLQDANGDGVSLVAATAVKFLMKTRTGTLKINASGVADPDQTTYPGRVSYTWQGTDTDTAGDYLAEWEVTFSGGKKQTFPNDSYILVKITSDLG